MNDREDGAVTALGIAILLAYKHGASEKLIQALAKATQQIQVDAADDVLHALDVGTRNIMKAHPLKPQKRKGK